MPKSPKKAVGINGVNNKEKRKRKEKKYDLEPANKKKLYIGGSFSWSVGEEPEIPENETNLGNTTKKKVGRKEQREKARLEEERISLAEKAILDDLRIPASTNEFERLIMTSPNSSIVWIQYMTFHLQGTEVEKARNIAKRALKTMHLSETSERLNIWLALINLEYNFSRQDFDNTLAEAVQFNDPVVIYDKTLTTIEQFNDLQTGKVLIDKILALDKSLKSWRRITEFYYHIEEYSSGRDCLVKASKIITPKEHIELVRHVAKLEFKFGIAQEGSVLYQELLKHWPQRIDICLEYVAALIKKGLNNDARNVLEHITNRTDLKPFKMQALFKKYQEIELEYGNEKSVAAVREKALKYLDSKN